MFKELRDIEELPRQSATQVKNQWGEVARQVRQQGSVAVTNHSAVDMVLMDAELYRELSKGMALLKSREQSVLDELASRFDSRLAVLQQPDAGRKLEAVFASRGKLARRPKAGASF
jgi:prevent-host-death family protein